MSTNKGFAEHRPTDAAQQHKTTEECFQGLTANPNTGTENMNTQLQLSYTEKRFDNNVIPFPLSKSAKAIAAAQAMTRSHLSTEEQVSERLVASLERARDAGRFSAILLFRISEYQLLVESFGHQLGAELSQLVTSRLQESLRKDGTHIIRLDDYVDQIAEDKFAIVLDHLETTSQAAIVAKRLIRHCSGNYQLQNQTLRVNSAIGIALYPSDASNAPELMRCAHVALRQANSNELTRFQFFNRELLDKQRHQVKMSADLERALEQERFMLHYQPQYTIDGNKIAGMEALIRMKSEDGDIISPDQFIPQAEATGLIVPIGNWVIREACQQLRRWRDAGCELSRIAVNVSPIQLMDDQIIDVISAAVSDAGLHYSDLELEITEQRMVENMQSVEFLLYKLSQKGVRISVDDFGTGYSSLAYIARLPLDVIKIDRSFVNDIIIDQRAARIVTGIVAMAKELELEVIVEGVETKAQQQFLLKTGCQMGQGFGLARPQNAEDIQKLLVTS